MLTLFGLEVSWVSLYYWTGIKKKIKKKSIPDLFKSCIWPVAIREVYYRSKPLYLPKWCHFRKFFLKLRVFANQGVSQLCPAVAAAANYAGCICRCREARSLPGFLFSLTRPDHLFRKVQEADWIHPGQKHLLTIPVLSWNCFRDAGQPSTQALHASEPGAWEKCQVPIPVMSWLCSWAASALPEMRSSREWLLAPATSPINRFGPVLERCPQVLQQTTASSS